MLKLAMLMIFSPFLCDAQCQPGFRQSPSGMCALMNSAAGDLFSAEQGCSAFSTNGHLVSISSAFDNSFIRAYAQETPGVPPVYIGLLDNDQTGSYLWIDRKAVNYMNWCPGYPSNANPSDNCVIMDVAFNGCWRNIHCDGPFLSVCEQGDLPFTNASSTTTTPSPPKCDNGFVQSPSGTCVRLNSQPADFYTAEQECETSSNGGHLVSVHSAFDNQFFRTSAMGVANSSSVYIGLVGTNITGVYLWIDHSFVSYTNWCPGYPSNDINTNCVIMNASTSGCWLNANCDRPFMSLCNEGATPNGCNANFTLMEDGYCYYASDIDMSFDDANSDCQVRGAHLVSIHSYWENLIAVKFLLYAHEVLHRQSYRVIWIGLQCHNASLSSCRWTDGSRFDYSALYYDLFSGFYWGRMYIHANSRGRWDTERGGNRFPFVCKHRSSVDVPETSDNQLPNCNIGYWSADSNTTCYGFDSLYQANWDLCDASCVQIGGRCASIHNQQQNSDIYEVFQTTQPPSDITDITNGFHIGLKENGTTWYWVDGTPYDNSFWMSTITQLSNNICPTAVYFGMGEIRSPGFPESYAFNRTCTYTLYDQITADPPNPGWVQRTKLAVYFITFVTHPLDVVEIFDGPNIDSPLIASVSGTAGAKQEYYSTGYNMTIRFISRVGNDFKGWRAVFGPYTSRP